MQASAVLAVLDLCDAAGVQVTVDGGWAVDAALGRQTRTHRDLDLALPADQLAALEALLRDQGFSRVPTADAWACNFVLGHADGRRIDLHGYVLDPEGGTAGGVPYIAEHLTGRGQIAGRPVRIVPPRWLVAFRSGYAMDAEDVADVSALCRRFGLTPAPDLVATARRLGIPLDLTPETGIETPKRKGAPPMSRTVYVNGQYLPEEEASVSVFDRGFLFADGVYEVTTVLDGKLIDFAGHAKRLQRSLDELDMAAPCTEDELLAIHRELVARNDVTEGLVYLQVTRGAADRDFAYPEGVAPTLVLFTQEKTVAESPAAAKGIKVISIEDQRWGRRDIKTVQLLYPSMGKMMAKSAGVDDAWLVEDGQVTEGTSNNAYIVKGGKIVTRELSNDILHGITRAAVLRFAREAQMEVEERAFTIEEAKVADEAFITSASTFVMPVVEIDGAALGDGTPGTVAKRLREIYIDESRKAAV